MFHGLVRGGRYLLRAGGGWCDRGIYLVYCHFRARDLRGDPVSIDIRAKGPRGNPGALPGPGLPGDALLGPGLPGAEAPAGPAVPPAGSGPAPPKVSVVIPALNEARNLPHVFSRLPAGLHEVIVVDGHSVDGTQDAARRLRPGTRIITQNRRGKGNALACGFAAATGDIIAMVDADGSADPAEIPRFVSALLAGADYAKGSRFTKGGGSSDITRLRRAGNRVLNALVNILCRTRYSDLCYGFNAIWRCHLPALGLDAESPAPADGTRLWGDGFEVETLMNIRVARAGLTVTEVPSYEYPRIHGVSNLNAFSDGWRVLRTILVERYQARTHTTPAPTTTS
ncbi:MAG: glycosyltransferase family 2 protein, partial [Streptosporangiaceae bacterium]|nr:glycosyltransferase family 2 protein [Streptosporangiaceae bacterium]